MPERVPVTFSPAGVTVWVERGTTVLQAARQAGVVLPAPCGGRGVCGACGFRAISGEPAPADDTERRGLVSAPQGVRLACRAKVAGPLEVRPLVNRGAAIPATSGAQVIDDALVAGVDLGTTSVSAVIVGMSTGRELGRSTVANSQQMWGADVLSRVAAALDGAGVDLRTAAEESVLAALGAACDRAGACLAGLRRVEIAGNTAMTALLAGADVASLAHAPFALPDRMAAIVASGPLATALPSDCEVGLVPPIGSFVGGDTSAGLLSAGLIGSDGVALLVDIGTNAEIAVAAPTGLTVSSAAAGPAFEGFGISSGGAWGTGAIESVSDGERDLELVVAGGGAPEWLCGSGLVSAIAALCRVGHISGDGRMSIQGPYRQRFADHDGILGISLGADGNGPFLLQTDVRAFQTAKAAVAAGIAATVSAAHVKPKAIRRLCLAGAFGGSLIDRDLVELGVIPSDVRHVLESVGDAAMLGAAMLAFDGSLYAGLSDLVRGARHIELAVEPGFADAFVRHTALEPFRIAKGLFG